MKKQNFENKNRPLPANTTERRQVSLLVEHEMSQNLELYNNMCQRARLGVENAMDPRHGYSPPNVTLVSLCF